MSKNAFAVLVIGTCAGAACAQSGVTVYGSMDLGVVHESGGPAGSSWNVESGVQAGSRLGFKGSENLGNGLSANFVIEGGIAGDTKEPLRNFYKMIAGQGEVILGFDVEMNALIASHKDIDDKVEMIPTKFMTVDFYVPFNKVYYAANKEQVEALWTAIGKTRKSKEYLDAIKDIK